MFVSGFAADRRGAFFPKRQLGCGAGSAGRSRFQRVAFGRKYFLGGRHWHRTLGALLSVADWSLVATIFDRQPDPAAPTNTFDYEPAFLIPPPLQRGGEGWGAFQTVSTVWPVGATVQTVFRSGAAGPAG